MKFTLTFSYVARRDFNNIYSYIYLLNPRSAKTTISNIVKQIELLRNFPELGKRVTQKSFFDYFDLRYLVIDKYIVYYTINKLTRTIEVHGVMKQSMNWQEILLNKTSELLSSKEKHIKENEVFHEMLKFTSNINQRLTDITSGNVVPSGNVRKKYNKK